MGKSNFHLLTSSVVGSFQWIIWWYFWHLKLKCFQTSFLYVYFVPKTKPYSHSFTHSPLTSSLSTQPLIVSECLFWCLTVSVCSLDKFWIVVLVLLTMTILYKPVTLTHRVFLCLDVKSSISVFVIIEIVTPWCYVFLWCVFHLCHRVIWRMISWWWWWDYSPNNNNICQRLFKYRAQSKGLVAFQACTTKSGYSF